MIDASRYASQWAPRLAFAFRTIKNITPAATYGRKIGVLFVRIASPSRNPASAKRHKEGRSMAQYKATKLAMTKKTSKGSSSTLLPKCRRRGCNAKAIVKNNAASAEDVFSNNQLSA